MKKIGLIVILMLTFVTIGTSLARKPAVQPVTGISIDDYKPVHPSQAQGFDFSSGKAKSLAPVKETPKSTSLPWPLIALLGLLPLAISVAIIKKSKKISGEKLEEPIDLASHRKEKEDQSNGWRKAS